MYGIVTRNVEELSCSSFDRGFYEVKDVTGRRAAPVGTATNMVSCFGDTAAGEDDPGLLSVNVDGERATREQPYFDWSYVCPTREDYRERLLDAVRECADASPDVRLDDVGFARPDYCRCEVCEARFAESGIDDWRAWREDVITDFVAEAVAEIPGRASLTLYPDPYPGRLSARSGIDLGALSGLVDEFVVPLYDTHYGTTYWLEAIAGGFADRLDVPLAIELYAVGVEPSALAHAAEVAADPARDVLFAYDAETAREAIAVLTDEDGADGPGE